ncbi:hypothetical protein BJ944DRAFT_234641 [Cunninghamella echinulata]|nr:hypothetical protein BJ944DRAFT_234641 [Cunninghamella echinulata]
MITNNTNNNNYIKKRLYCDSDGNEAIDIKRSCSQIIQDRVPDFNLLFFYECDFKSSAVNDIELVRKHYKGFINEKSLPIMISTDTANVHRAFFSSKIQGALEPLPFPILADATRLISRYFKVLNENTGNPERSVFVIDSNQIVKYKNTPSCLFKEDPYTMSHIFNAITRISQNI